MLLFAVSHSLGTGGYSDCFCTRPETCRGIMDVDGGTGAKRLISFSFHGKLLGF